MKVKVKLSGEQRVINGMGQKEKVVGTEGICSKYLIYLHRVTAYAKEKGGRRLMRECDCKTEGSPGLCDWAGTLEIAQRSLFLMLHVLGEVQRLHILDS